MVGPAAPLLVAEFTQVHRRHATSPRVLSPTLRAAAIGSPSREAPVTDRQILRTGDVEGWGECQMDGRVEGLVLREIGRGYASGMEWM